HARGAGRGGERGRGDQGRRRHRPLGADVEHHRAQAVSGRLVVIGAGPVGLGAALGAIRRGFDVTVLEAESVGASLRRWGPTPFFTPLAMNLPPGAREALGAAGRALPPDDAMLSGGQMAAEVLEPLASSPPLAGRVRAGCRVLGVGRAGMIRGDYP